ncbi:beta strand repeat-containing protein [Aliarcobacter cryaerophilus]|uniref:beta strand repeat-containing protein n=1 Tax=Aliarcobacter cryaerophilus TaxID=28198 RepID=UPI0021B623A1|nr:GLUG motif-containing protein [Aliarcobacter cryaerophilus]MCT7406699.1 filamentous hemagglutinin N-terminal domain-containing protein [Aliarcobacter cryaerophilus]MCT7504435.1 filamentous hemagglutinin N-terminal domain-containing protein [Aliarcobacter cryaerophilus]
MYLKQDFSSRFRILKGGKISLVVSAILGSVIVANASPSGGTVVSGTATINQSGNTTNINQSSQKASINWQNFSIANGETVNFNQPNQNSITLNRVIGNEKSIIDGALNANGQVWILNQNGTLFGKNAKVNTSGLLVTTKNLSDEDFQKGNYNFKGDSTATIENLGFIDSKKYSSFIANSVINNGTIKVHTGNLHLIGANEFSITLDENSNISLKVTKGVLDALVENNNLLIANGGNVYLTTNAKDELLKGVVNNKGIIEANSLDDLKQSEVIIFAHGGTANIDGTINAKGSFVETSGEKLSVKDSFKIQAKTWLLDPTNITIESTGGSIGNESVSATAIQNALSGTDVELQADNNITVNQNITWSEATQLRLTADNINVNATINNTNQTNGGVYFNAANRSNKVVFGINGKVVVNNINQMQWINTALNGKYELGSNINASATSTWNSNGSGGYYGFNSIGDNSTLDNNSRFTGTFDGKGFAISDLYINRPITDQVGLFGYIHDATIKNIGLENVSITGGGYWVGGLVGFNRQGTIQNSHVTGAVSGSYRVGGLVGNNYYGQIENSYALGSVSGTQSVGGLVGLNDSSGTITINNSYAISSVTGSDYIGGFVGSNYNGTIENSYASGSVIGSSFVGGFFGVNASGTITNSYYDNQANTGSMDDTSRGRTKAQIVSLLTGSEWTTDSSEGRGYSLDGTTDLPFLKNVTKLSNTLFEDGLGTSTNPYTITNWTQLQNINISNILISNSYFNLVNNLDSQTSDYINLASNTANGGAGWKPIGDNSTLDNNSRFIGTFDGLRHTISDLFISRTGTNNVGLFGASANGSTIENLGLLNVNISAEIFTGAIAGRNYGTISNSYATGNISGSLEVGGLVGRNLGIISNSYTLSDVTGTSNIGGLVGYTFGGTISNSYASGTVTGTSNIGGLVGNNSGIINSSFYDNEANTSTSMSDTSRGRTKAEILALVGSPWSNAIWGITAGGTSVEGYEAVLLPYLIGVTREEDKSKSILFAGGFGTSNDAYEITNWTQLQNINNLGVLNQNYYFKLLNNLDSSSTGYMGNTGDGWNPIGNYNTLFAGTFDGLGHTILDLYINRPSSSYVGLFGYTDSGVTIKNLGLLNAIVTGDNSVSAIAGNNDGRIENTYVSNSNITGNNSVGAITGNNVGTIKNTYVSNSNITGNSDVGAIVGINNGIIQNSYVTDSTITGNNNVGAIAGDNWGTIQNSYYDSSVTSNVTLNDTTLARTKAEILTAFSTLTTDWGITAGGASVEGFEGVLLPYLIGVTRDEDISTTILFAGGYGTSNDAYEITNWTQLQNINNLGVLNQNYYFKLLNNLDSQTSDYTNLASSTANGGLGWRSIGNNSTFDDNSRFIGTFDGQGNTISDLYIKQLTGQSASNVGLFGYITTGATIQNIGLLNVDITGLYSVGGLLGYNNGGTIEKSYVIGIVNGTQFVGGLVGYNFLGTIKSSYFSGIVSGTHQIGGLTGRNYTASINNSYAIGSVTASGGSAGGLVGANEIGATITNSYASGTVNGVGNIGGLTGFNAGVGIINNSFYDTDKHLGTAVGLGSLDGVTGKTTAELEDINTFKDTGWTIVEDNTLAKGTPILKNGSWVIGTYTASTTPEPNSTPSENIDIQKIVDSIQKNVEKSTFNQKYENSLVEIEFIGDGVNIPNDIVTSSNELQGLGN